MLHLYLYPVLCFVFESLVPALVQPYTIQLSDQLQGILAHLSLN